MYYLVTYARFFQSTQLKSIYSLKHEFNARIFISFKNSYKTLKKCIGI